MKMVRLKVSIWGNLLKLFLCFALAGFILSGCTEEPKHIGEKQVVAETAQLNPTASEILESSLKDAVANNGHLANHYLRFADHVLNLYKKNDYEPLWTNAGQWTLQADSLYFLVNSALTVGLFPEDYHADKLKMLREKILADTSNKQNSLDAALWAEADLLFTSAFVNLAKDVKAGRLVADSTLKKDSVINSRFFEQQLVAFKEGNTAQFLSRLEPAHDGYVNLKQSLKDFLTTADLRKYTYINSMDSLNLNKLVQQRLSEEDTSISTALEPDTVMVAGAIRKYQKRHELKVDGKLTAALINRLNNTDREKFIRIGINLDRYKQLPALPSRYIWVNIPGYQLQVKEDAITVLNSKIVVGKPNTQTPLLTSTITDMITYPKWHIPNSIIVKEILPALKKDVTYLAKKGYSLSDYSGNEIDPATIDWSKYEKSIPYRVIQGSGDDNALGVIKFNFPNKHAVYLHDTNQRHLFSKEKRALSHGCVRVESWDTLAYYLLDQDTTSVNATPIDSLQTWLALKEKHVVPLRNRVPLYIRYFTCEAEDGNLVLHEDIYGEDRRLREKYFKEK
ncbi:MAG TPA: L,D-transpeptidase family protein [Chitinophagaceae bacterium]